MRSYKYFVHTQTGTRSAIWYIRYIVMLILVMHANFNFAQSIRLHCKWQWVEKPLHFDVPPHVHSIHTRNCALYPHNLRVHECYKEQHPKHTLLLHRASELRSVRIKKKISKFESNMNRSFCARC